MNLELARIIYLRLLNYCIEFQKLETTSLGLITPTIPLKWVWNSLYITYICFIITLPSLVLLACRPTTPYFLVNNEFTTLKENKLYKVKFIAKECE